jgi:hypothetical protein
VAFDLSVKKLVAATMVADQPVRVDLNLILGEARECKGLLHRYRFIHTPAYAARNALPSLIIIRVEATARRICRALAGFHF